MDYLIVAKWDEKGVITKVNYAEEENLQEIFEVVKKKYKKAFAVEWPEKALTFYKVVNNNSLQLNQKILDESEELKIIIQRNKERGSIEKQLEFIVENGIEAYITRDKEIRAKYPKDKK